MRGWVGATLAYLARRLSPHFWGRLLVSISAPGLTVQKGTKWDFTALATWRGAGMNREVGVAPSVHEHELVWIVGEEPASSSRWLVYWSYLTAAVVDEEAERMKGCCGFPALMDILRVCWSFSS